MSSSTNTLGKYQIIREIARSNDIVYEATDPTINRRIALKELCIPVNLTGAQRQERIERFWREGKAAGRLSHPNIVTIHEVGKDGDRHFIAMEFLEGQTLRDVLQAGGALAIGDAVNYTLQLLGALSYAHANGVIHRDIKPENVQILPGGHVKLTDFGIARLMGEPSITQNGQVFGTPSYMSPEQVAGKSLDARSDIFSVGVLLYEMVSGQKPFSGDSVVTITYNIMNMEPAPPAGTPPWITGIIRKAMAKDPGARYSSADEMIQDLRDQRSPDGLAYGQDAGGYPSMFDGASQVSPQPTQQGPMTPYGTPMPSPDPGWYGGTGTNAPPDPFASQQQPASTAPPAPPKPILSSETRSLLGVVFLAIGLAGLLVFAIWAIHLAYGSFITAQTSGSALNYYNQGVRLQKAGRVDDAVDQWRHAIRVSPKSDIARRAKEQILTVRVESARAQLDRRNAVALGQQAADLVKEFPDRPEGHYYLGAAAQLANNLEAAKESYLRAVELGGADAYAQAARRELGHIFIREGDDLRQRGDVAAARRAYESAEQHGDSSILPLAQERLSALGKP